MIEDSKRSIVVTTYGFETAHTQHCLGRIRRWKSADDEVVVVVHDESPTLRLFLELCCKLRIIDRLLYAPDGHGHVRGVNLGISACRSDVIFNVCIDMRIGGAVIDECTRMLCERANTGMVGWHYDWSADMEGPTWSDGSLRYSLRNLDDHSRAGRLFPEHVHNIRNAAWATGRVLDAVGDLRFVCCNGSFFGVRKSLWDRLGGFDERIYPVHFADDLFTYAVLDQGFDVLNIPRAYRCGARPEEFLALTDLGWQGLEDPYKGVDAIDWNCAQPDERFSTRENVFFDLLARTLASDAVVSVVDHAAVPPVLHGRSRSVGAGADVPADSDVILVAARAPSQRRREALSGLRPGGVLITVGGLLADNPERDRVDSLRVAWRDEPRTGFDRSCA